MIIVDDGSPDAVEIDAVVSAYPQVRLLRLPENRGKYKAMNFGIPQTTGDAVIILDADDTLVQGWPLVMVRVASTGRANVRSAFRHAGHRMAGRRYPIPTIRAL